MNVFHVLVQLFEEYDSLVSSSCSGHAVLLQIQTRNMLNTAWKVINIMHVLHQLLYKRQRDIRMLPMYSAPVTHRHWLWSVKFALEGTVASEVGIRDVTHIPVDRSLMD
jgi:hypothetical protein